MLAGMQQHTYSVRGISCSHCKAAIEEEVGKVTGVASVDADVASKLVVVTGAFDDGEVRAAIDEAGYEAE